MNLSVLISTIVHRLKPATGGLSVETQRHERVRRVAWSGAISMISTGVGLVVSFVAMPLTIHYLGSARYGIWITIGSLLSWIAITDMGLGSTALVNALSDARGRDDVSQMRSLVSTAFYILSGLAMILLVMFAISFPFVPWDRVLNAGGLVELHELHLAIIFAFISFALLFPLSICSAVYSGLQEGYVAHGWAIAGHMGSLVALVTVTFFKGGLPLLVLAITASRTLMLGANAAHLFWRRHPEIKPSFQSVSKTSFLRLANLGWKYLLQQLANIGMFQSQPMLIIQFIGPAAVGVYNVAYRILSIPQVLIGLILIPLVPAYGEAKARNDWPWIWKTLMRTIMMSVGLSVITVLPLALLARPVVRHWISPDIVPSWGIIISLGLYTVVTMAVTPLAIFFNGIERVGSMASVALLNAAATIGLALILIPRMGIAGMGIAMMLGFAVTNLAGQLWLLARLRSEHKVKAEQ